MFPDASWTKVSHGNVSYMISQGKQKMAKKLAKKGGKMGPKMGLKISKNERN